MHQEARSLTMREDHLHLAQHDFGLLLKRQREQWQLKQRDVLAHLPGWTQANYSRLESGAIAPAFDQLLPLYTAFGLAGARWNATSRRQFLELAHNRQQEKKTHWDHHSEADWAQLRYQLADVEVLNEEPPSSASPSEPARPLLADTRHLVGREAWVAAVLHALTETPPKKLVVLQGPMGVGKSSELHRLAWHFLRAQQPGYQVLWLPLLMPQQAAVDPQAVLEVFLGNMLAEMGNPLPASSSVSLHTRMQYVLTELEHHNRPTVILLDNAESLLSEQGTLAPCWQEFLAAFLRAQHQARLLLATKEWPGWPGRERIFVSEFTVPLLSVPTSVTLLQRLGLERVPLEHLRAISEQIGGIPLCLEWVAALVQDALSFDDWQSFDPGGIASTEQTEGEAITGRLLRLLEDPSLLRGHFANQLQPLLERIIDKRLSPQARRVLHLLALSPLPLGKAALQVLCERPSLIKELRDASLLIAYPSRIQLLPMVASAIQARLTPEEINDLSAQVIEALTRWIEEGSMHTQEAGTIITELTVLLLQQHRLLDAAQLLLSYRSLSFNLGYAPRLARLATDIMQQIDWHTPIEIECGGLLLDYLLSPFLGKVIDDKERAVNYQHILNMAFDGKPVLQPSIEAHITSHLMLHAMNELRFEEAQVLLDTCCTHLEALQSMRPGLQVYLIELRAWLFGAWCDYTEERGEKQTSQKLREQAIVLYKKCVALHSIHKEQSFLKSGLAKTRLARCANALSYYLMRYGHYEEALQSVEQSIVLREQGYLDFGGLAVSYGEKSEILTELGRFKEALLFNEKAQAEIQRLANAGYPHAQAETWMYLANCGRIYLRMGKIDEAEQLLQETVPHISARRRVYRMFAEEALEEIEQWKRATTSPQYQLDWRWVERYRQLASFDSYWWLASAGPFTQEEQQQWDQTYTLDIDEATKEQLSILITQTRQREIETALAERREPHLHYPALPVEEVRHHIAGLLQLKTEIRQQEPNALVRLFYGDTIEEELTFLRLIEATYEGNNEQFWKCNLLLNPLPSKEEMQYALSHVTHFLAQGLQQATTAATSQQLAQFFQEDLHLSLDLASHNGAAQQEQYHSPLPATHPQRMISAQTARKFFTAALQEGGYEGWQVKIDANASNPRIEQGLRHLYLPEKPLSMRQIKQYLSHELAGHVARCVAGERSLLGLLGIHSKNSLETEEGLAMYYDIQTAKQQGQIHDDAGAWFGTLATGLAGGVLTSPQTFRSLFTFFEQFTFLYRLLKWPHLQDSQAAMKYARSFALTRCLRTFRGIPDLRQAGVCYSKDAHYLRGLRKIERAVAEDSTILDQLATGVVALEWLPELRELGMVSSPQPLRKLANDPDLDTYILSFEAPEEAASPGVSSSGQ